MKKKVALITGGASDIGISISKRLIELGYLVFMTYHNENIELESSSIRKVQCDLKSNDSILSLIKTIKKETKKIDLVVSLAALSIDNKIEDKTKEEFIDVLDVNVVAPFLLVKYLEKYLDGGVFISIASTDGIDTYNEYNIDYATSKAALIHMMKILAYIFPNIYFYTISPNFIDTKAIREMNPIFLNDELKRIGQTKLIKVNYITDVVVKLLNKNKKSGSNIIIKDGINNEK